MSRISVKHSNQKSMEYSDFSGGLNTSNAVEMIAMNELSKAVNVELDPSTGLLKTVDGTEDVYLNDDLSLNAFFYDKTNTSFILCTTAKKVYYLYDLGSLFEIGTLTGNVFPEFAPWEDGVLIASGGKMQYAYTFYETVSGGVRVLRRRLETISESPDVCNGVFVKGGRIWTYYNDTLHCSGVGDEHGWTSTSGDDSTSKDLEVGYKDTGKIVGVTNLSSDILIVKDNGHAYHLSGDYPDWTLKEVSRDIHCRGFRACCALANEAVVLSESMLQSVTTTEAYGDMRADEISRKVKAQILALPDSVRIKYIPVLNQLWFLTGKKKFLFMDCGKRAFFERKYNSDAMDALAVGDDVYVLKAHKIQKLKNRSPSDDGKELQWEFWGKTIVSPNEYLVKRIRVSVTPEANIHHECMFLVGNVPVVARLSRHMSQVYQDSTVVYESPREVYEPYMEPEYSSSEIVYGSREEVYNSELPLVTASMYRTDKRCVQRLRSVRMLGRGNGGKFLFNSIEYEYVEV